MNGLVGQNEAKTMLVYRDEKGLAHIPGPNPGTPYTKCGLDAGAMKRRDHPIAAALLWCSNCLQAAGDRP